MNKHSIPGPIIQEEEIAVCHIIHHILIVNENVRKGMYLDAIINCGWGVLARCAVVVS